MGRMWFLSSGSPLTITVTGRGSSGGSSPSPNGSTVSSPVHFVASASTSCAKGVASMGIYTSPFKRAYLNIRGPYAGHRL